MQGKQQSERLHLQKKMQKKEEEKQEQNMRNSQALPKEKKKHLYRLKKKHIFQGDLKKEGEIW